MKNRPGSKRNAVRIIGGSHRGRKIEFPTRDELRPTSDRIRETLFNWLQRSIQRSDCLDLFAGSGALGVEALSRGADAVVFVESNREVAEAIQQNLKQLELEGGNVVNADAIGWLKSGSAAAASFNIVFLDPPFNKTDLYQICAELERSECLAEHCLIYIETGAALDDNCIPETWGVLKSKKTGNVYFYLLERQL